MTTIQISHVSELIPGDAWTVTTSKLFSKAVMHHDGLVMLYAPHDERWSLGHFGNVPVPTQVTRGGQPIETWLTRPLPTHAQDGQIAEMDRQRERAGWYSDVMEDAHG